MIRRLLDLGAIACGLLALLIVALLAMSYAMPRTFCVERMSWTSPGEREVVTTLLRLNAGRVSPYRFDVRYTASGGTINIGPFPPRPTGRNRVEQVDLTFLLAPLPQPPPSYRVGEERSLFWPTLAVAVPALAMAVTRLAVRTPSPGVPRRRTRQLVAGAIGAAGVLLVASIVFCIRSYPYFDRVDCAVPFIAGEQAIQLNSSRGSAMVAWTRLGPNHTLGGGRFLYLRSTIPATRGPLWQAAELLPDRYEQAFGFTLGSDGGSGLPRNVFIAPYWAVFAALAAVIALCVRTLRRLRDRDVVDRCKRCGYDCRGLADRCPECGTPIVAAA